MLDETKIITVVEKLKAGEIVALPTETVYGFAVDAYNGDAIGKLYKLKQRLAAKPVAIAVAEVKDITPWVATVNEEATMLIEKFWPGPLTLVFPVRNDAPQIVNPNQPGIGIRCSSSPILKQVIHLLGHAICLTSANLSGQPEAKKAEQVRQTFKGTIYVLEQDEAIMGIASTVVDVTMQPYRLLREGAIAAHLIEQVFC